MTAIRHITGLATFTHTPKPNPVITDPQPFETSIDFIEIIGAFCAVYHLIMFDGEVIYTISTGYGHMTGWSITKQSADSAPEVIEEGVDRINDTGLKEVLFEALPPGVSESFQAQNAITQLMFGD